LRKALFAIALVLAAFAGGAVVNGPGLGRLKGFLQTRLVPGDPRAVAASADPDAPPPPADGPPPEVPAAPLPPLRLARDRRTPRTVSATEGTPREPRDPAIDVAPPPPRSEAAPVEAAGPEAGPSPSPTSTPAAGQGPSPGPADEARTADPAVAAASQPSTTSASASARDWSDLRRRMRELGVSRYEVDGEPAGRSRFRCLIPLAGRRAVGQQFEAEGDDDYQAADAALRRVALWRATEMAPP